jgi:hypothetical protein
MEVTSALIVEEVKKHEDGRVDLLGLFEDIYVEHVPVVVDGLTLFLDLELAPEDKGRQHAMELRLIDAEGRVVQPPTKIAFDVPGDDLYPRATAQLDLDFPDVTFKSFGAHHLEVFLNGRRARRVYLSIQQQSRA